MWTELLALAEGKQRDASLLVMQEFHTDDATILVAYHLIRIQGLALFKLCHVCTFFR